jgi:hypothetical protein
MPADLAASGIEDRVVPEAIQDALQGDRLAHDASPIKSA